MIEIAFYIIGSLLIIGAIYQVISAKLDEQRYPALGEMINIGGRSLHVVRTQLSKDAPTVILEAGNGLTSTSWMLVQPEIAKFANCMSYDRAGFGWSKPSPDLCISVNDMKDLHHVLEKLGMPTPYIFVGHSYGGMLGRLYAAHYPDEIAGIVLVDAYHEEQVKSIPLPSSRIMTVFRIMALFGVFRLFVQKLFPLPATLPAQMRKRIHAEISAYTWTQTTKNIFSHVDESLLPFRSLPILDKPMTVISAGIHSGPELRLKRLFEKSPII